MQNAEHWVLQELTDLEFKPYAELLPQVSENFRLLRALEVAFREAIGNRMTKRQAVVYGLLARTFQLSVSCLVNQLLQNHSGWSCSYRSLMETFFVADWIQQQPNRLEAYFESHAPTIGRIKSDCCRRHPEYAEKYNVASQVTHVETLALHLPRTCSACKLEDLPFTATEMSIAGTTLAQNLRFFDELQGVLISRLQSLINLREKLNSGEVLWEQGFSKSKFGCLRYEPRGLDNGFVDSCGTGNGEG
jgi:hypothetical protein